MIFGRYFFLGLGLSFAGTTTSVVSFFLAHLIPLTALGIAAVIVGVTAATLPEQVTGSYAMKVLLRGSTLGIDPLLDEILARRGKTSNPNLQNPNPAGNYALEDVEGEKREEGGPKQGKIPRAIYLPPKMKESSIATKSPSEDERSSVYIPLRDHILPTLEEMRAAPATLLSEDKSQDGIRVFTAGAYLGQVAEIRGEDVTIEDALEYILVESAELCTSVRASEIEDTIVIEIDDVKVEPESESYRTLLGSLPTSLAASVVASIRGVPVVIANEDIAPTKTVARLLILGGK